MSIDGPQRENSQRGFTLAEIILLVVVLGIAFAGITVALNTAVRGSADPMIRKQSIAIAESLMDEILLMPFDKPALSAFAGGCANATQANRSQFDGVSDYDCFATAGIVTIDGTAVPGLGGYNVAVTVANSALSTAPAVDSKLITIAVAAPQPQANFVLEGYKLKYP